MRAGYAEADITPKERITLCGFVARQNKPFETIDDFLSVRALALKEGNSTVVLLSFDLLGLGHDITERIHQDLDVLDGFSIPRENRILCCTHTHSAPAAVKLIGCGIIERSYVEQVIAAARQAAIEACKKLQAAHLRIARLSIPNANYNRRRVLEDGRVIMTQDPDARIRRIGSTWDDFLFLRFETDSAKPISGVVNWAAHACTVCANNVSGDYPAELCRQLSKRFEMPFVYLQGACANLNPPLREMTRKEMLENVSSIMEAVPDISWSKPVKTTPFAATSQTLCLHYQPIPKLSELEEMDDGMKLIAETGCGPDQQVKELANILNVNPGQEPDPEMMKHTASALQQWSKELIEDAAEGCLAGCDLLITVWRIGEVVLCSVGAELFVETATAIRNEFPGLTVVFIGCGSPLVGYLPTDEAIDEGGYEVEYAYRFYGRPAAFTKGSEPAVAAGIKNLIESLS